MKRKVWFSVFILVFCLAIAWFTSPVAAATYSGYGKTTRKILWLYTWTWHSWTTVDTSQDTLTVQVAYPNGWTDLWNYYTFLSGFVLIEDNWRTYGPFLWTFQNHWGGGGLYWWSISFPYTNAYTGMIVTVFWFYGGVDITGDPTATEVHLQYGLWVGNGGGGGCPTLSVYNGEEYVMEGSLNIHASEDVVVSHTLMVTPEPEGCAYLLRLTEPDLPDSHSYIDQVKLLAVDKSGNTKELRLISAVHSEHGNVLPQLLFSDDTRTDTLPYQTIDLKFLAPTWQSEEFIFVIEGYNMK